MVNTRKSTTCIDYHRMWKLCFAWCESRGFYLQSFSVGQMVLSCSWVWTSVWLKYHQGPDLFRYLFQILLASHSLIKGASHVAPPVKILSALTHHVIFLVFTYATWVSELATLSCMENLFLVLFRGKLVLRPRPAFLSKVDSALPLIQDIVLCVQLQFVPSSSKGDFSPLFGCGSSCLRVPLCNISFRRLILFFVLPHEPRKGHLCF